jgi:hypothetical protein
VKDSLVKRKGQQVGYTQKFCVYKEMCVLRKIHYFTAVLLQRQLSPQASDFFGFAITIGGGIILF